MRSPARWIIGICLTLVFFSTLLSLGITKAHAQTPLPPQAPVTQLLQPNVEGNVPMNQHTLIQSVLIETFSALGCQLVGIDITAPTQQCLSVNWQTNQLGYAPASQTGEPPIGGLLQMANQSIAFMYVPMTSSTDYFRYVARNFSIVKTADAAPVDGFQSLTPLLPLWTASRNIAYFLLTIAFVFIGLGVMLRIRIDPRTVMTVQNRIPDVIICILLITFSYAIPALMIDGMWLTTYTGINVITAANDPNIPGCKDKGGTDKDLNKLSKQAENQLLSSPFTFVDAVFLQQCEETAGLPNFHSGILDISKDIANNFVALEKDVILAVLGVDENKKCSFTDPLDCGLKLLFAGAAWFASFAWWLIIVVAILIAVFRVWFELIKAYVAIIVYIVTGPVWIVFGLLPKKPLGFQAWIRRLFANFSIFVAVACGVVFLREVSELYKTDAANSFVPILVGNPNAGNFGAVIVLGGLLMLPHLLGLIRDKLGAKPSPIGAAAGAGLAAGAAAAGAVPKKALGRLNKRDQYGGALGPLARLKDAGVTKAFDTASKYKIPFAKGAAERSKYIQEHGNLRGYKPSDGSTQQFATKLAERGGTIPAAGAPGMQYTADAAGARRHTIDQKIADLTSKKDSGKLGPFREKRATKKIEKLTQEKASMGDHGMEKIPQKPPTEDAENTGGTPPAGTPPTGQPGGEKPGGEQSVTRLDVGLLNVQNIHLEKEADIQPQEKAHSYLERVMKDGSPESLTKPADIPDLTPEQMTQTDITNLTRHVATNAAQIKAVHKKTQPPETKE